MNYKIEMDKTVERLNKKRTVYGYDIVKAVGVAFRIAERHGDKCTPENITDILLNIMFDKDYMFDILHVKAKKDYDEALGPDGFAAKLMHQINELLKDADADADDDTDDGSGIAESIAELFGVKKEEKK